MLRFVLAEVMPYLYIKRKQAELCLQAMNINTTYYQYTKEQDELWNKLYNEIKQLNKVGIDALNGIEIYNHKFSWAWLAGLIDGDGSIYTSNFGKQTKIVMKIALTHHVVIDYISTIVKRKPKLDKVRGNRRVTKSIRLLSNSMLFVIPEIQLFLVLKHEVARLAYEIILLRQKVVNKANPIVLENINKINFLNRNKQYDYLKEVAEISHGIVISYLSNLIRFNRNKYIQFIELTPQAKPQVTPNICKSDRNYIMIYEDEWLKRKDCIKHLILNKLGCNLVKFKLRPSQCTIKLLNNKDIKLFYEKYHYQGYAISTHNIGVFHKDKLIACMSIKRPTRQNSGDWEISRMACSYDYRIHGIWSYLIKWIISNKLLSGKLITFSDNRLMIGKVYELMGFKNIGDIKPDYYWVKGNKRYHKSALRKRGIEKQSGLTETNLRTMQGYNKIYDLGKIKWEIVI